MNPFRSLFGILYHTVSDLANWATWP